ncbi:MAG: hypothetical protein QG597_1788 [Actinomycetota bacterium]|nr:hypothetical protein [Actinomycetota bacterium]
MEVLLRVGAGIAGTALLAATIHAILASMLVPRPMTPRLARLASAPSRVAFRFLALRRSTYTARDSLLAAVGPVTVLVQLVSFVLCFILAAALLLFAVSGVDATRALYSASSALFTLGVVEPAQPAAIAIGVGAAFIGLVVVAVLVGYLLTLYSAYADRESEVAKLGLLAGEPAWGPELLSRSALLQGADRDRLYEDWIQWASNTRLNHIVYPILNQFRSSQPHRHWLVSLVAVLDAANLELTTLARCESRGRLVRLMAEGCETLAALRASSFGPPESTRATAGQAGSGPLGAAVAAGSASAHPLVATSAAETHLDQGERATIAAITADAAASLQGMDPGWSVKVDADPGVTRDEWQRACDVLTASGLSLRADRDAAWHAFAAMRTRYAPNAYVLAQHVYAAPAPWTGPRTPTVDTIWPTLASDLLDGDRPCEPRSPH